MQPSPEQFSILTTKVCIRPECKNAFGDWQAKIHATVSTFPGFASLEISSPFDASQLTWMIVQRFHDSKSASDWQQSQERKALLDDVKEFLDTKPDSFQDFEGLSSYSPIGVTEVFVTQVTPEKEEIFREWIAKIHQAESKFPGYKGVFVQTPKQGKAKNWITFLQFDTQANLDRWLSSPERKELLNEAKSLIESLDSHQVISPFAGWFASVAKEGVAPSVWKQTMIVLLVLFPIVMLELKFLPYLTGSLNPSLSTFIGNAISVTLIAWPLMPIAIPLLKWWLVPEEKEQTKINWMGTILLIILYLIEIAIFWKLI